MRYTILALTGIFLILAFACSTAKVRVMPGEDGTHRAVSKDIESDDAEEAAVEAANEYCEKQDKKAVFVKDSTKYKGDMDEGARKTVRKASKAAVMLGAIGSPVSAAGQAGHVMTGDRDYENEVLFKCK